MLGLRRCRPQGVLCEEIVTFLLAGYRNRIGASKSARRAPFGRNPRHPARRDELWFDRRPALAFCLSMIPRVTPEGMLFGKPDSTFPDHAQEPCCGSATPYRITSTRQDRSDIGRKGGLQSRSPRLCRNVTTCRITTAARGRARIVARPLIARATPDDFRADRCRGSRSRRQHCGHAGARADPRRDGGIDPPCRGACRRRRGARASATSRRAILGELAGAIALDPPCADRGEGRDRPSDTRNAAARTSPRAPRHHAGSPNWSHRRSRSETSRSSSMAAKSARSRSSANPATKSPSSGKMRPRSRARSYCSMWRWSESSTCCSAACSAR